MTNESNKPSESLNVPEQSSKRMSLDELCEALKGVTLDVNQAGLDRIKAEIDAEFERLQKLVPPSNPTDSNQFGVDVPATFGLVWKGTIQPTAEALAAANQRPDESSPETKNISVEMDVRLVVDEKSVETFLLAWEQGHTIDAPCSKVMERIITKTVLHTQNQQMANPVEHPKSMNWKDFMDEGFLFEVNRRFFHPLGLAMTVHQSSNTDDPTVIGVSIQDGRDDPEGMIFGDFIYEGEEYQTKHKKVEEIRLKKAEARIQKLGFDVQPMTKPQSSETHLP